MRDEIHSRGELIDELAEIYFRKKRIPTASDVNTEHRKGLCASYSTYHKRFGGFKNAVEILKSRLDLEQLSLKYD